MKKSAKSKALLPHQVGDKVMAKFPGATSLWYKAEITHNTGVYKVQFEDGTKHELEPSAVKSIDAYETKSPNRRRSPGRQQAKKSPARQKSSSPGRARRQRSESPVRRSPSRTRRSSRSPARSKQATSGEDSAPVRQSERVRKAERVAAAAAAAAAAERVETLDGGDGLRRRGGEDRGSRSPAHLVALQTARVATVAAPDVMLRGDNNLLHDDNSLRHAPADGLRFFGGGFGTFFWTLMTPALVIAVNIMCTKQRCTILEMPVIYTNLRQYVDGLAVAIYVGWVLFLAILSLLPIGRLVNGTYLADGERLTYRLNGLLTFFLSMAAVGGLFYYRLAYVDVVYARIFQMMLASIVFSILLSIGLFVRSLYVDKRRLSAAGSGGYIYGFFMGRELNPRFFGFDLKFFLELRPGLIGWAVLNVVFILKDYQTHDFLNHNLMMLTAFQIIYVVDALLFEESILTTMDITTEGLGFMLTCGNLSFVPFLFSFSSRFLLEHPTRHQWYYLAAIALVFLFGYILFRMSNMQKNKFRRNPTDPSIAGWRIIQTGQAKNILADGCWRHLRHPNYLGELIMALSWSLLVGNTYILPHFYSVYLLLFLIHRAVRDNATCAKKYGRAWDEYRRLVPSAIFPKIF